MLDWNNNPLPSPTQPEKGGNPCIAAFGPGPQDKQCKDCYHMVAKQYAKVYWKCDLRKNTNGTGTDHKRTWPSCARFEQAEIEPPQPQRKRKQEQAEAEAQLREIGRNLTLS